jgi:hypothetical protein
MRLGAMLRKRVWLVSISLLVIVVMLATVWIEPERNEREEYAVYSAYMSQELLDNAHDWSVDVPVLLVISETTEAAGDLRFWVQRMLDARIRFHQLQRSTRTSYIAHNLFSSRIRSRFVLPSRADVAIVSERDLHSYSYGTPAFEKRFPRNIGLIILSGIGFNPTHTQAVFYFNHLCGLCGGGRYVLMEKINGSWRVREEHYTWIS